MAMKMINGIKDNHIAIPKTAAEQKEGNLSEGQIWHNFKQGSEEAYAYMYNTYFFILFNYGRQFCSSRDLIKDCIQDLFVELWEKRERLGDTDAIKYYLFKCLRRKITKKLPKHHFIAVDKEMIASDAFPMVLPLEYHMIEELKEKEKVQRLRQAVNALSVKQREVIFLTFYENLTQQQVALVLSVEIKTVRNLLWKSIKALRNILVTTSLLSLISTISDLF